MRIPILSANFSAQELERLFKLQFEVLPNTQLQIEDDPENTYGSNQVLVVIMQPAENALASIITAIVSVWTVLKKSRSSNIIIKDAGETGEIRFPIDIPENERVKMLKQANELEQIQYIVIEDKEEKK